MIDHPDDFIPTDLGHAPWGGGEPDAPADVSPSEALYGFAGWLTTRDQAVTFGATHDSATAADLVKAYCESQGFEAPRDDFHHNLRPGPRDEAESDLQRLVYRLMTRGADVHALIGLPKDLGDARISNLQVWFEGLLGQQLRFQVRARIGELDLVDSLELGAHVVPMEPAFAAAAVEAMREHLLRRVGLATGESEPIHMDEHGNRLPT